MTEGYFLGVSNWSGDSEVKEGVVSYLGGRTEVKEGVVSYLGGRTEVKCLS